MEDGLVLLNVNFTAAFSLLGSPLSNNSIKVNLSSVKHKLLLNRGKASSLFQVSTDLGLKDSTPYSHFMKKGGSPKDTSGILSSPVLWAENNLESPAAAKATAPTSALSPLPPHFISSAFSLPSFPL